MTNHLTFEFPLGEFVRTCLKINRLYKLFIQNSASLEDADNRNLLFHVLELHNLVSRPELKNELIKEIEKRFLKLKKLQQSPNIDSSALTDALQQLEEKLSALKAIPSDSYSKPLPYMVDSVKQRLSIPGGQFEFDLPMFHYWLQHNKNNCSADILNSIATFQPIIETSGILLDFLRKSATANKRIAENGIYQLTDSNEFELLILQLDKQLLVYPEISGGRHRVFIRFLEYVDMNEKPQQTTENISFSLICSKL